MDIDRHSVYSWYLLIVTVVTFVIYGVDKLCAKQDWRRVPEMTLLLLALLGGSAGAIAAMQLFRHKTLHLKFKYGVPLILILQIAGLIYLHLPK